MYILKIRYRGIEEIIQSACIDNTNVLALHVANPMLLILVQYPGIPTYGFLVMPRESPVCRERKRL